MLGMTASVTEDLSRCAVSKICCRKAEISAVLRFAGGLHIIGGNVVLEAELNTAVTARRLRQDIAAVYRHKTDLVVMGAKGIARGRRYVVRVGADGEVLARQTGLIDTKGHLVKGLAPRVVNGAVCDAEAAWRGAFLARGSLTEPGRGSSMELTCPGPEAALALVGGARRMGIVAKASEVRGVDRVVIRDGDAIAAMLTRLGACDAVLIWQERRSRHEVRATARRLANFDDANLQRSARAAVTASALAEQAMHLLGDQVPDHLAKAGLLRIDHQQASLEELGRLAQPAMTKDAIAGRIRRLLALADKVAQERGIPGIDVNLAPDVLEG